MSTDTEAEARLHEGAEDPRDNSFAQYGSAVNTALSRQAEAERRSDASLRKTYNALIQSPMYALLLANHYSTGGDSLTMLCARLYNAGRMERPRASVRLAGRQDV